MMPGAMRVRLVVPSAAVTDALLLRPLLRQLLLTAVIEHEVLLLRMLMMLVALLMAIGILMDDAIVISESIETEYQWPSTRQPWRSY